MIEQSETTRHAITAHFFEAQSAIAHVSFVLNSDGSEKKVVFRSEI